MKVLKYIACLLLIGSTGLFAHEVKDEISLLGGYQHGHFKQENILFLLETDTVEPDLVDSKVDLGVFGLDGRFFMPNLDCLCEMPCLNNLYLTGHAIWGWNNGDRFSEDETAFALTDQPLPKYFPSFLLDAKGKLKKVRTYNYEIGLGYLFDLGCLDLSFLSCCNGLNLEGWSFGIEGGYSYRKQDLKTKRADIGEFDTLLDAGSFTPNDPAYHGVKYNSKWQGGWIGGELFYQTCAWDFNLGYQYHISRYTGINHTSAAGLAEGFASLNLKSNHAHGDVWTLKTNYDLWCGWSIGTFFCYEHWKAHKGSFRFVAPATTFEAILGTNDVKTAIKSSWNSYTLAARLGYEF